MNKQKQQQIISTVPIIRQCIICQCGQSENNELMKMFTDRQFICRKCYIQQNHMIVQYKKNKPVLYPDYHLIVDQVYLGNQDTAICQDIFEQKNIRAVLVCGSYLLTPFEGKQMGGKFTNILYKKLDIADFPSQQILQLFDETTQWVNNVIKQGRNLLIHCAAGVSRSSSFTIAYLMRYHKISLKDAHKLVKDKRKLIRPNSGFLKQLQMYQHRLCQITNNQKIE